MEQIFFLENTFRKFPFYRTPYGGLPLKKSLGGVLYVKHLMEVFFLQNTSWRSSFYRTPPGGLLSIEHDQEVFFLGGYFYRRPPRDVFNEK